MGNETSAFLVPFLRQRVPYLIFFHFKGDLYEPGRFCRFGNLVANGNLPQGNSRFIRKS